MLTAWLLRRLGLLAVALSIFALALCAQVSTEMPRCRWRL